MIRVAFTSKKQLYKRVSHFFNTLKRKNIVVFDHNKSSIPDADIWLIDHVYESDYFNANLAWFEQFLPYVLNFAGKVVLLNSNDNFTYALQIYPKDLLDRIDGIIALNKPLNNSKHVEFLAKKTVLLPRFTIDYLPEGAPIKKENKVFFIGKLTGADFFSGKNWRIECFKKINANPYILQNFVGWISTPKNFEINKKILDVYNIENIPIAKEQIIPEKEYFNNLLKYQISLCLPGNTSWGYRHLLSLAAKTTIVSFDLSNDSGEWLFQHEFKNTMYVIDPHLNNFESVVSQSILEKEKSLHYAQLSYEVYRNFFELLPDNTYQDHVWRRILNSFESIHLNI